MSDIALAKPSTKAMRHRSLSSFAKASGVSLGGPHPMTITCSGGSPARVRQCSVALGKALCQQSMPLTCEVARPGFAHTEAASARDAADLPEA
eukprot:CAMPEP_0172781008 /NCGR_PEP_ID=MMETSP1074-20121228/203213_1 /TAXON_ID=2916 /ORGANISM="Ceratium fusus, Strain PA161109" /LENGTH=92 /DNA_ID=CAMNT_0013617985 /DNA_START=983 /DNA_END=1262 /DNA_ORIENTATION=+